MVLAADDLRGAAAADDLRLRVVVAGGLGLPLDSPHAADALLHAAHNLANHVPLILETVLARAYLRPQ
jgi:hypothetical protein